MGRPSYFFESVPDGLRPNFHLSILTIKRFSAEHTYI